MEERRQHYRRRSSTLFATVLLDTGQHRGRVRDTSAGGARIAFPIREAPTLALGEVIEVSVSGGGMESDRSIRAVVRNRHEGLDWRTYGVSFQESNNAPDQSGLFNRRRHPRVRPTEPQLVVVQGVDGASAGHSWRATLLDLSAGGCALLMPQEVDALLSTAGRVSVTLALPGQVNTRTLTAQIRNRAQVDGGARYGLQFEDTGASAPDPIYEPWWDCPSCAEKGLLALSHLHCPRCGLAQPQQLKTYYPDWDQLKPSHQHRFAGTSQRCLGCGTTHGPQPRHCGGCGQRLPL